MFLFCQFITWDWRAAPGDQVLWAIDADQLKSGLWKFDYQDPGLFYIDEFLRIIKLLLYLRIQTDLLLLVIYFLLFFPCMFWDTDDLSLIERLANYILRHGTEKWIVRLRWKDNFYFFPSKYKYLHTEIHIREYGSSVLE